MGKRRHPNSSNRANKQQRTEAGESKRDDSRNNKWYDTHDNKEALYSAKFEAYYKGRIVPEDEWDKFIDTLRSPLPVSFRLSTISGLHEKILKTLQGSCFGLPKTPVIHEIDGEKVSVQAPNVLPWYSPLGHAYQVQLGKKALKKIPELSAFREFLIREDGQGNITRQEAVSMIPPQLLGVQPHHIVLDMCAAPGSKTAQLLEDLHSGGPNTVPSGVVIANDADHKRAYMLVHQLKRLGSPAFLVSTHQGQFYPNLYIPTASKYASEHLAYLAAPTGKTDLPARKTDLTPSAIDNTSLTTPNVNSTVNVSPLLFDRILCDVPCSGDGTLRKCPSMWRTWSIGGGMGLHPLQLAIAWRSAQMLKVGGRMVYSTCSLNPIENEAVVAELIRRSRGALRIVDVSDKLPGLIRESGLHSWEVLIEHNPATKNQQDNSMSEESQNNEEEPIESTDKADTVSANKLKLFSLKTLQDINSLPFLKRRRLRTSFFPPDTLFSMKVELDAGATAVDDVVSDVAEGDKKKSVKADDYFSAKSTVFNHLPSSEEMHLERCVRILPHKQDTGGFFITLIEKVDVLPTWDGFFNSDKLGKKEQMEVNENATEELITTDVMNADEATEAKETEEDAIESMAENSESKKVYPHGFTKKLDFKDKPKEKQWNDFPFVNLQQQLCDRLQEEFGLDSSKGYHPRNLFNRSDNLVGNGRKIYFLSDTVSDIVNTPHNFRLKIVHSGLKVFEASANAAAKASKHDLSSDGPMASEGKTSYRIAQDAISFILPFLTKQILHVQTTDLISLLKATNSGVRYMDLSPSTNEVVSFFPEFAQPEELAARKAANKPIIGLGSCVVTVKSEDLPEDLAHVSHHLVCAGWRSHATLSLMLAETERSSLLNLLEPKILETSSVTTTPTD